MNLEERQKREIEELKKSIEETKGKILFHVNQMEVLNEDLTALEEALHILEHAPEVYFEGEDKE